MSLQTCLILGILNKWPWKVCMTFTFKFDLFSGEGGERRPREWSRLMNHHSSITRHFILGMCAFLADHSLGVIVVVGVVVCIQKLEYWPWPLNQTSWALAPKCDAFSVKSVLLTISCVYDWIKDWTINQIKLCFWLSEKIPYHSLRIKAVLFIC